MQILQFDGLEITCFARTWYSVVLVYIIHFISINVIVKLLYFVNSFMFTIIQLISDKVVYQMISYTP